MELAPRKLNNANPLLVAAGEELAQGLESMFVRTAVNTIRVRSSVETIVLGGKEFDQLVFELVDYDYKMSEQSIQGAAKAFLKQHRAMPSNVKVLLIYRRHDD